ncbi:MAG: N-acetyl-gamma-glutamyl-phosphate reductase [Bacteroidales bacterium]|nr:N-acetyl-gamma-glutamyl-phosphate reductase [Bacteroidales bacterium]
MIKVGIIGGTGYVAGELIRLLLQHPETELSFVYSHSQAGKKISEVHQDLFAATEMKFTDQVLKDTDVLFLSLGHGLSKKWLQENPVSGGTKIIDMSNDFRLNEDAQFAERTFVYGLPETNKSLISQSDSIANPGCFATAIQLGLLPLASDHKLTGSVHIYGITGSTGAGNQFAETTHFSWRNNNISVYKPFVHQHLGEIGETVKTLQPEFDQELNFIPVRGDFTRGIFISLYTEIELSDEELNKLYQGYYQHAPFTFVSANPIHMKQVVNSNYGLVHVEKINGKALVTVAIDNLLKGAAGQAVENMNLMVGFPQDKGLSLKANYF